MKYLREDSTYIIAICDRCGKEIKARKSNGKVAGNYYVFDFPVSCTCGNMDKNIKMKVNQIVKVVEKVKPVKPVKPPMKNYNDVVKCPKCGSTQITASTKGYGIGKAIGGVALLGPIGLLGGLVGSKKVIVTCLMCGTQWQAGKNGM